MALQFSDTTNYLGLIQMCESQLFGNDYGAISDNTDNLKTFTRYINNAYDELIIKILNSDTRWQFDDTTYTDYPIGTTTLVDGQQDYILDDTHMKILSVHVKNTDGNYIPLLPIDEWDITQSQGTSPDEFYKTDGMPRYYDKMANSVFLYPAPSASDVTTSEGLKIRYQRNPNYFTYTDTTKEPGIPSPFHRYLAMKASLDYAVDNTITQKVQILKVMVDELTEEIQNYYNDRDVEDKPKLQAKKVNFK